jgi:UDP-3-O-[3-hydroxymyristoyl] glucosamine N-acyltransferase
MTVGELAALVEGRVVGDSNLEIRALAPVFQAGAGEMALLADSRYLEHVPESRAEALLIAADLEGEVEPSRFGALLVVERPHAVLPTLLEALFPEEKPAPSIHPTAVLGEGVKLGVEVSIGAYVVVEEGARIGDRTRIGSHVSVGRDVQIGEDCVVHPQVVLYPRTRIGNRVILHAGARLGVDGFGYASSEAGHAKVPQVGACVIEDDVEIGANTCIDRGSIGRTVVGAGAKVDNLVHLAHNVTVGERSLLVAQVGIAGSTRVGRGVVMAGQVGIAGHLKIGDGAALGAQSGLMHDVPAGEEWFGYPAQPARGYFRSVGVFYRLPELMKRLRALERAKG